MYKNYKTLGLGRDTGLIGNWKMKSLFSFFFLLFGVLGVNAQVTTNSGSGLNASYGSLSAAVTALNAATITSPVVITLAANETAPLGGYSITATGTVANTITLNGAGFAVTAPTPQASGVLTDAIFKIIGGDYITINGFLMNENASNTTAAAGTNNMTEFGVALLYATTTNGAQNCTISGNTITLNRTYQNTFGIYSNSTHSATVITTSASATTAAGGNSGMKVYGNTITNVNQGIVVVGPTAAADANTGIDIGGTGGAQANSITNFGTTGAFSGYANVSGTVNGILVRNSIGFNISFNNLTSSNGGVTSGTLNGIQIPAASATPTTTFTNTINSNAIALTSGVITGAINGINYLSGSASPTSTLNVNSNNFTSANYSATASGTVILIVVASTNQFTTINSNTFTNISSNTTGSFTFISQSFTAPATGTKAVNNNSIVTGFAKTGAGGTVIFVTDNGSTVAGAVSNCQNNNFSNVTLTGATAITGINYTDGGTGPTRTVTGNTLNNWTTGAATINAMNFTYWNGTSSLSSNTITNITGQGAVTGITIGAAVSTATLVTIGSNIINNLSSTGTGGAVTGITCSNASTSINISGNAINTLSSTGASAVTGINISGSTSTNVFKNKIYDLSGSNASSTVNGVLVSAGTLATVYNNIIGDLRTTAANAANPLNGINITGGTTANVFFNTVRLSGTSSGALFGSSAISASTSVALTLRNNIFVNTSSTTGAGLAVAYRRSTTTLTTYNAASNNNLFFASANYYTDGTNTDATFAAYKTRVSTRDNASINESPTFVSITGSNVNFLHIDPAVSTQIESGATAISGITDDFDGNTRNVSTPDIGADEFAGSSPAPSVSALTITPTGNQCTAVSRAIAVTATTPAGTITGVTLNYAFNGTAQTAIAMTNTSGNIWEGTIPVASPTNANVTWSVTATSSLSLTASLTGTAYQDNPLFGTTAAATASPSTICAGGPTTLSALFSAGTGSVTAGTGTGLTADTAQPTAFNNRFSNYWSQTIYTAAELQVLGLSAGNITGIRYNIATLGSAATNGNFTVKIGSIAGTAFSNTTFLSTTGFTNVYGPVTHTHTASGFQTITFSSPYVWDGVSNIIINVTMDGANSANNTQTFFTTTDNKTLTAIAFTGSTTTGTLSTNRLNVTFLGQLGVLPTSVSWSDGISSVGTGNNLSVSPSATTTYTATLSYNSCPGGTATTTVTVLPLPSAPTATDGFRCGSGLVTSATVTSTTGAPTPTFRWYAAPTGGTVLQSSTSASYTTSVLSTTTFYVTEFNGTCESSPRTPITLTVNAPPTIAVTTTTGNQVNCGAGPFNIVLTASSADTGMTYSWSTASTTAVINSGATTPTLNVTVTESTDFIVTGTPTDPTCNPVVFTYPISVYPLPVATVTTTATGVCPGTSATINSGLSAGNFSSLSIGHSPKTAPGTAVTLVTGGAAVVTQTSGNLDDGGWGAIPIGFNFNFFGTGYTTINIGTNGTAMFGTYSSTGLGDFAFTTLPSISEPFNLVAILAMDNNFTGTDGGAIKYWTEGTSPNRRFIISYESVKEHLDTKYSTSQAIFYETTGVIEVHVTSSTNVDRNKLVGINNGDGTIGVLAYASGTTATATNPITTPFAYRFSPPANYNVVWSTVGPGNVLTPVSTGTNFFSLTVSPAATTTYDLRYTNQTTGCTNIADSNRVTMTIINNVAPSTTAVANVSTICVGGAVNLSLTGNTNSIGNTDGLTYQWQISTDGGTSYTDIAAATSANLSVLPVVASMYHCLVSVCSGTAVASSAVSIGFTNSIVSTLGDTKCGTQAHSLTATGNTGTTIKWYAAATGGTALFTGSPYTPTVSVPTTFYAEAETTGCSSLRVGVLADVTAPPVLTLNTSTIAACENTLTSSAVTLTSNPLDFDTYTWSPSLGVSGNETTGWYFNVATTTAFTLTASQSTGLNPCSNVATVNVTVNPILLTTTASATTVCAGSPVTLNGVIPSDVTLGTNNAVSAISTSGTPYRTGAGAGTHRTQYVVLASELTAAGVAAGNINSLGFTVTNVPTGFMTNLTFSLGSTSATSVGTTYLTDAVNQLFTAPTYTPVTGLNTHDFSTPFVWDGISNILINVCGEVTVAGGGSGTTLATFQTTNQSTIAGTAGCSALTGSNPTGNVRPVLTFGLPVAGYTYVWNDGSSNFATTASTIVNPTTTTTYTLTATRTSDGCTKPSTKLITVIALPPTPTASNSTQCGPGTPSCSVTGVSGASVFEWFLVPTGGTALVGQAGSSLTAYPIIATTDFYVSEKSGICSSPRVMVTASVTAPGVATPTTAVSSATINIGGTTTLTATGTGGTINWYSAATGGTVVFTGASFTPAVSCAAGTVTYYAEEDASPACPSLRASASYTVRSLITSDPANGLICSTGGSVDLSANVTGGSNFVWTPSTGLSSTNTALTTASPTTTTVYTFTCTVVGCGTQTGTFTVGVIDGATFTATALPTSVCEGGTTVLNSNLNTTNFTAKCITPVTVLSTPPVTAVTLASGNALTALGSLPVGVTRNSTSTDDNFWKGIDVGFTFNYFGSNVTKLAISTNGTIDLANVGSTQYIFTGGFPNASNPASTIALCARDLRFDTGNGAIRYWTEGIAPTRKFIVQYDNVDTFTGTVPGKQSAEAVFYETTGLVDIRVIQATNATDATINSLVKYIGLQDATRLIGATSPNCSTLVNNYWNGVQDQITSPQAWRFTPAANYSFQWFTNGNPIDGATSSTYTTPALTTPGTVTYTVEATNPNTVCASAGSVSVTVNAAPTAPISGGDITECANLVPVTLTATAPSGSVVDWYAASTGGSPLVSGTNTYNVSVAGTYYAQSRSTVGSCTSAARTAVVYTQYAVPNAPTATSPLTFCQNGTTSALTATADLGNTLSWYTVAAGGTGSAIAPTPSTATAGSTNYWVAQVTPEGCISTRTQITVNVNAAPGAPTTTPNGPYCQNAVATQLSATATGLNTLNWYTVASGGSSSSTAPTPDTSVAGTFVYYVSQTNASSCESVRAAITVVVNPTLTASVAVSASSTSACSASAITFTATPTNGGTPTYQWYLNGGLLSGETASTYTLVAPVVSDFVYVIMTSTATPCLAGSPATSNTITLTAVAATPTVAIAVSQNTAVCAGTSLSFSVLSSTDMGASPTYQWNLNGSPISGETNATYVTSTLANADSITLTMTSSLNPLCVTSQSATSSAIVVNVNPVTTVTNPIDANVCSGASVTFSVTASGTGPFTYQWKKGASDIALATSSSYVIPSASAGDVASYSVVVTGTCGIATSLGASLTLKTATSVSGQPIAVTQCAGTTANFNVTANGAGTLTYQWRRNGSPLTGETASTLAIANIAAANAGNYSVVVTGDCGSVTSSNALLTVQPTVVITSPPSSAAFCAGSTANFSVTATGLGLTYQWKFNGNDIVGQTSATLSLTNVQSSNAGAYTVVVGSTCGTLTSSPDAVLTVNPTTAITTQPSSVVVCAGGTATFTVATVGVGAITYQWTKNGVNISGETASTLILTNVTDAGNAGVYRVKVSGGTCSGGTITSSAAALSVPENTVFLTSGAGTNNQTVCSSTAMSNITFGTTTATGATVTGLPAGLTGVWASNVFTISGSTTQTGVFPYTVTTTGGCATDATATGTITVNLLNTISLTSAPSSNAQNLCNPSDFVTITYATTAATGATFTGLPAGVSGSWSSNVVTISGLPTVNGSFNYTVTLTGGCGTVTATGNITIDTATWNGSAWVGGILPNATRGAIFTGNYTSAVGVAGDLIACSLTVLNNAIVTVSSGADFDIKGKVDVQSGSLTFENNANLLQEGTTNVNTGEITSKRINSSMRRLDYTYWSSPTAKSTYSLKMFSPMTISLIPFSPGGVTGASRFYYLDETLNSFTSVEPTTTFFDDSNIARGWNIRAPNDFPSNAIPQNAPTATFNANWIGKPNSGDITIPVTYSGTGKGSNLIGNPYPSVIDALKFLNYSPDGNVTKPNAGTLYFWTHTTQGSGGNNYATFNLSGGTRAQAVTSVNPEEGKPDGTIQVGQGFLLKKSVSSTVVFNNDMRYLTDPNPSANNQGQFFKTTTIEKNRIWLNLATEATPLSQMMVGYIEGTTLGFDDSYDGKLINPGSTISSIIDNENYTIQARPTPFVNTDEVPLNFKADTAGSYTLSIDEVDGLFLGDQNIYLRDNLLNITHDIKASSYTFASEQGTFNSRFDVVYNNSTLNIPTPTFDANSVIVYKNDNKVLSINAGKVVMKNVKIYDVRGRLIYEKSNINATTAALNDLKAEQEVLLVKITSDDNKVVTKKVVF